MTSARRLLPAVVAALALLLVGPGGRAGAQDDIRSTKHNFSGSRDPAFNPLGVANYGEVCVYCHTPHGGQTQTPLWNRPHATPGAYSMYSSPTINMTIDPQPSGVSLACLSCHDGTIGIDVVTNPPNTAPGKDAVPTKKTIADIYPGEGSFDNRDAFKNLSQDLRNDHPISVMYDPSKDGMFNTVASITDAGLKLYDGKVQCASCHNPHNKTNVPFLRKANANSDLCLTCHIK
jgi:predicted CXXCH cytochrome family protein